MNASNDQPPAGSHHSQCGNGGSHAAADTAQPAWVAQSTCVETLDARELIERGGHPLPQVMAMLHRLHPGQSCRLMTPFVPAPLISRARAQGYVAWTEQQDANCFQTHFAIA